MSGGVMEVKLKRMDTSQPWGFRLKGGADQGISLHVENVSGFFIDMQYIVWRYKSSSILVWISIVVLTRFSAQSTEYTSRPLLVYLHCNTSEARKVK